MKNIIDKTTPISLGLFIALISVLISGGVYITMISGRITRLETVMETHISNPSIHHQRFKEMEHKYELLQELLVEVKGIKIEMVDVKERLKIIERK